MDGTGPFDPARDETALRIIAAAVEHDRPILGICRGFQEIAVAYGATLDPILVNPIANKYTTRRLACR